MLVRQSHNSDLSIAWVFLVADVLIGAQQEVETRLFGTQDKLTVADGLPTISEARITSCPEWLRATGLGVPSELSPKIFRKHLPTAQPLTSNPPSHLPTIC